MNHLKMVERLNMTVKEYAEKQGVSKQSVYDRIKRGTLQVELIQGVRHIVESSSQLKGFEALLPNIDRDCPKKLEKALKKALKSKHKLDLAIVKLNSMQTLLNSRDEQIATLKSSFDMIGSLVGKKILQSPVEEDVIDLKPIKKKSKKSKKKK